MGIKKWSKTANSNDSISSSAGTINWKEGMPPSAVNDSARVTMADVRDWYEDSQWVNLGDADGTTNPRRAANELSLSGTHTLTYHVGRRIKALDTTGTKYGTITGTTFSGGTQITLTLDSGTLTGSVSQIWLSALSAVNPSTGQAQVKGLTTADTPVFAGVNLGDDNLNTYDKGTFTPVIRGSSTAGTQTYSTQRGQYIRIGDMVWCWIKLVMSAKDGTTAGDLQIAGLPFTSSNTANYGGALNVSVWQNIDLNTGAGYYSVGGFVDQNSTVIALFENGDNNALSALTAADLAATSLIFASLIYEAA